MMLEIVSLNQNDDGSASSLFLMREKGKWCLLWLDAIGEEGEESDK